MHGSTRGQLFRTMALGAILLLPFADAMILAGCSSVGLGYSSDRFVYRSNEWQPWTVTLTDSRTGESVWSVDVPVGKQLIVGFRRGVGPSEFKPDMMYWGISENGRTISRQSNQVPVPPAHSRVLEPTLRPVPELPGTPLPGSPYADAMPVEKTIAARKGKIPPKSTDLFAPAKPNPGQSAASPVEAPAAPEPSPTPSDAIPAAPQPQPEPAKTEDPPIDLPQGDRGPG